MPPRLLLPVLLTFAVAATATVTNGQSRDTSSLDEMLDKVSDYVTSYTRDFVGVVAEETYRQDVRDHSTRVDSRGFPVEGARQSRTLRSDMLLVRAPAGDRWLQFRDVFEVDGKPVRDREERLAKLFLTPSASAERQVDDIKSASARYNIGGVNRNINLPVLALSAFELSNRPWFTFELGRAKGTQSELSFREERSDTLIRGRDERGTPSYGKFVVERATGRVLSSELHADTVTLKAEIDVTYGAEAAVGGLFVPREMREKYESKDGTTIEGRATYAKFRRYTVTVDEKIKQ
jgi:hypothetical protein